MVIWCHAKAPFQEFLWSKRCPLALSEVVSGWETYRLREAEASVLLGLDRTDELEFRGPLRKLLDIGRRLDGSCGGSPQDSIISNEI